MSSSEPTSPIARLFDGPLYVATGNPHKAEEIAAILAPLGIEVRRPDALPHVVEDGNSFAANARIKARAGAAHLQAPCLADDSGLVVPVLGGRPGIHSARFAGENATDADNNARLIAELSAIGAQEPPASFTCFVTIARPDGTIVAEAEGQVDGILRWPPKGSDGFGYDPLFFHPPSGCTTAELSQEAKNRISHRGRALRSLAEALKSAAS